MQSQVISIHAAEGPVPGHWIDKTQVELEAKTTPPTPTPPINNQIFNEQNC